MRIEQEEDNVFADLGLPLAAGIKRIADVCVLRHGGSRRGLEEFLAEVNELRIKGRARD